jgi:hypothetical protein
MPECCASAHLGVCLGLRLFLGVLPLHLPLLLPGQQLLVQQQQLVCGFGVAQGDTIILAENDSNGSKITV